eukprot:scaffold298543_cov39-Tisochrysis_lutea.AAC.2
MRFKKASAIMTASSLTLRPATIAVINAAISAWSASVTASGVSECVGGHGDEQVTRSETKFEPSMTFSSVSTESSDGCRNCSVEMAQLHSLHTTSWLTVRIVLLEAQIELGDAKGALISRKSAQQEAADERFESSSTTVGLRGKILFFPDE